MLLLLLLLQWEETALDCCLSVEYFLVQGGGGGADGSCRAPSGAFMGCLLVVGVVGVIYSREEKRLVCTSLCLGLFRAVLALKNLIFVVSAPTWRA